MKILFATDGSPAATRALGTLLDRRALFAPKLEVLLLTVHGAVPYGGAAAWVGKQTLARYYAEESDEALVPAQELLRARGVDFETIKRVGEPADEIIACAQERHCDLVALGAQGHSALEELVVGSVAHEVCARSPVPVLLLR